MQFAEIPVAEAEGAILAHSVMAGGVAFKKGRLLTAEDVSDLQASKVRCVFAARLQADDVPEDEAARRLAAAVAGPGTAVSKAFTGRANVSADAFGIAVFDGGRLDAFNMVDEAVTLATVPSYTLTEPKRMLATLKIIPFAVPESVVAECERIASDGGPLLRVAPFREKKAGLIQTRLENTKDKLLEKTSAVLSGRLGVLGSHLHQETRCRHTIEETAAAIGGALKAGCDLLLLMGAGSITDRRDVIPAAIEAAGGTVVHFGMPVDPGNLMLLGQIGGTPVIGMPGCARSPQINGFDWVLDRLCAELTVTRTDIMRLGAGGLLKEIPGRPLPRGQATEEAPAAAGPQIAALILAAGQSLRGGPADVLLHEIDGEPMVARVAQCIAESQAGPVVAVVSGDDPGVRQALADFEVTVTENPDTRGGLSSSLKRGIAALPGDVDGVLVCLGDMPDVRAADLDALVRAFDPVEGRAVCVPVFEGHRGNPLLIGHQFFAEIQDIAGDIGARYLIGAYPELVAEVEIDNPGVLHKKDAPD